MTNQKANSLTHDEVSSYIDSMPDEVLSRIQFSMPWQYDTEEKTYTDPDDFAVGTGTSKKGDTELTRDVLQGECWDKFNKNPQINTAVRGNVGRICGAGFEVSSEIWEIQEVLDEIEEDPRNRLYNFWPKYVGRSNIEGELFLSLTCHKDGFVEVDFIDPSTVRGSNNSNTGIIYHPTKTMMPLFYIINGGTQEEQQIPSIYIARYPDLVNIASKDPAFNAKYQRTSKDSGNKFKKLGGFNRFIVNWDKSFITERSISYLRTTLEWLNHYENLKKYEIDHKKSSGSYMWIFKITDPRTFKLWLSLSDSDRRKTGIMAKKTPGGSLVLPPGIEVEVKNPNLTAIRDQDTDIFHMITSGLNEPEDISSGKSGGTYASVKASRGPMSDRISDEIAYFDRFLIHDFWGSIFFLRSAVTSFPTVFKIKEAIGFKNGEVVEKYVKRRPEKLLDISHPTSELVDYESRAKGLLGVKHASIVDTLGIPQKEVATKLGFTNYGRLRLKYETERNKYPDLPLQIDPEGVQEYLQSEPSNSRKAENKETAKKETKKDE